MDDDLRSRVQARQWYHTLELAPGVVTPGWFDTRGVARRLPFPPLAGKRCLDVGTFEGFWAFEMERRGAAEVVAVDVLDSEDFDWPAVSRQVDVDAIAQRKGTGDGFDIAKQAVGSSVERVDCSVYDLRPDRIGRFDFVYVGSLLIHLRDPVGALERVRGVCGGQMMSVDTYDVGLTASHPRQAVASLDGEGRPYWWKANLASLRQMITVAGFRIDSGPKPFMMPTGAGHPRPPVVNKRLATKEGRATILRSRWGDPHAVTLATPVPVRRPSHST
jgi:tRNA (mo5U34)-methyltransferase